ncbi:alpha/beta hydrolase-fold protein [Galbibacter pacificus]|uniref:Alpha/beta hydrolase-fold protein n=1 Tax=Galbibacter pacificus TaxID=2996052 RepID=A0ABT6FN02_9FLAO|nr:alpha/beta hydrolase-fold protein [Galbibacter pacificus]MDG3581164.1 alpha/beta hydrolase-fold protein [Galbibacter pacificus]MDG3584642.1 alpha/beta hydrolase-fold protein [Galbibacter pacificus]
MDYVSWNMKHPSRYTPHPTQNVVEYQYKNLIMRLLFAFVSCLFFDTLSLAQESGTHINIGVNHVIKSSILKEDRVIQIYTPDGYSGSKQKYPVLYILDGQWYFLSGVAIQKAFHNSPRAIPEMIVVGINTSNPLRRKLFGTESEKFTDFLMNEVIYYIESNYRINEERVIFGWEDAAYYISGLILEKGNVFDGAIISDGGYATEDQVNGFASKKDVYLFMANSKKDIYYIDSTEAFHEILKEASPERLIWKYDLFNDEVHESLAHLAIYKGLKYYYYNYNSPVFKSIQEYVDLGGMDYLTAYFKKRAKRFDFDDQIDNDTKNMLIWLAWKRNNFEYFNFFMTKFEDVLATQRYASAYWQNRLGQFYLKHNDYENAIKYFNAGLTRYPNSKFEEQMQKGLTVAKDKKIN